MERRNFLSTVTAGLVAPVSAEFEDQPPTGGGPFPIESPARKSWRENMVFEIESNMRLAQLSEDASDGDLALMGEILRTWTCCGGSTDRTSGLCWAIDVCVGRELRRVACKESVVLQVESVVDVLESLHDQHAPEYRSDGKEERDALLGAFAAFVYAADKQPIEALGKAVERHYQRAFQA